MPTARKLAILLFATSTSFFLQTSAELIDGARGSAAVFRESRSDIRTLQDPNRAFSSAHDRANSGSSEDDQSIDARDGRIFTEQKRRAALAVSATNTAQRTDMALRGCMGRAENAEPFTLQHYIDGQPARLKPELELSTSKDPAFGVTAVTISSLSRITQLEGLCASWGGPMSAAVYVGLQPPSAQPDEEDEEELQTESYNQAHSLQSAIDIVRAIFEGIEEQEGGCQFSITLFSELLAGDVETQLFPFNALRNGAHLAAATQLLFNVDADMLLSHSLTETLSDPIRMQQLLQVAESRAFIVVPAFEGKTLQASTAATRSKWAAVEALRRREITRFATHFPRGHAATNYTRWVATKAGSDPVFESSFRIGFEGWGIISRRLAPLWDVKYRGYGKDKISWTHYLGLARFRLVVMGGGFMVHRPHKPTRPSSSWVTSVREGNSNHQAIAKLSTLPAGLLLDINTRFFNTDVAAMEQHRYRTVVGNVASCRDVLPHWHIFGPEGAMPVV